MAQSMEEIAKEITLAWLNTMAGGAAKTEVSGKDAGKAGDFVGDFYLAILKKVDSQRASTG